jgi:hypothetical protein
LTARAPEVGFSGFDLDGEGAFLGDVWGWHVGWLQCWGFGELTVFGVKWKFCRFGVRDT